MSGVAPDPFAVWARLLGPEDEDWVENHTHLRMVKRDVRVLVEVARAARAFGIGDSEWSRVEAALARLDKDPAPPEADPSLIKKWNPA